MPDKPHPPWSRRDLLRGAAASTAVACTPKGGDSGAAEARPPSIDTVIVVMMENRSFDHWLGARPLLEGTAEDGLTGAESNPDADGAEVLVHEAEEPCPDDPPHGWSSSHDQFNGGANDGFVTEYAPRTSDGGRAVMGYQTRAQLPISWALADAFTVCDRYFCSVMGPTWPNRLFGHMASSQGATGNDLPSDSVGFNEPNIWRALGAAGVDWGYYYGDVPFLGLLADTWDADKIGFMETFFERAEAGTLPPVVWLDPAFSYNDNHPPHHPGLGELFIGSIYEAMAASPQWERCLIVLTYDEHGGFYDHVPPPSCEDDRAEEGFDQLGFRVPTQLIGPWVKQGVVSTVFDHASWIRMVCEMHGIELWNKRLQWTTSLAEAIDADRMARNEPLPAPDLPAFDFDPETVGDECFYGRQHRVIEHFAEMMIARGLPVRFHDRDALVRPFLRSFKRRGLVG